MSDKLHSCYHSNVHWLWMIRKTCTLWRSSLSRGKKSAELIPYSQELTNASWQKQELNVTLSSERVNGIPVYTLTDTAVNNTHYIRYSYSHIAGNKYMMSATVKAGTLSYVQLAPPGGISLEYANFDLSNGTITGTILLDYHSSIWGDWLLQNIILLYITCNSITGYLSGYDWFTNCSSSTNLCWDRKDNPCNCYANWRCNLSERITPSRICIYKRTYNSSFSRCECRLSEILWYWCKLSSNTKNNTQMITCWVNKNKYM